MHMHLKVRSAAALLAAALSAIGFTAVAPPAANAVTSGIGFGIHDASINDCDNGRMWSGAQVDPVTTADETAAKIAFHDVNWRSGLNAGSVRFIAPWDIALPDSPDSALITAHDPTAPATANPAANWASLHSALVAKEQACFDFWLAAAATNHVTVEVDLNPDNDYRSTTFNADGSVTTRVLAPDAATYATAVQDFVSQYVTCTAFGAVAGEQRCNTKPAGGAEPEPPSVSQIHIIAPWNEPDFTSSVTHGNTLATTAGTIPAAAQQDLVQPSLTTALNRPACPSGTATTNCGPALAASYFSSVSTACGTICTLNGKPAGSGVVAGDFSSAIGSQKGTVLNSATGTSASQPYWKTYTQLLPGMPQTWAIHPYSDVSKWEYCTSEGDSFPTTPTQLNTVLFAGDLHGQGYGPSTGIWLNEISAFQGDMDTHQNPPDGCDVNPLGVKPTYSQHRQDLAFDWEFNTLPTLVPATDPQVTRLMYFDASVHQDQEDRVLIIGDTTSCLYQTVATRDTDTVPAGC